MRESYWTESAGSHEGPSELALTSGSRVGIIGGGPAGAFFSYFLLDIAQRLGTDLEVDLYEMRDFSRPAPYGCNMCGGIVSETLVQVLATEGINLPDLVIQRGIDSYVLHMDVGDVRIETPLHEKRIGSVQRGGGPRDVSEVKWGSFDGYLESLAVEKGARVVRSRVQKVDWDDGRPRLKARDREPETYDLLVVAAGVNAGSQALFRELGFGYQAPTTVKTYIQEHFLGEELCDRLLGSSMHVFLLNLPGLEFAAIIPKGDYAKVCLLGTDIDDALVRAFLDAPPVKRCFPSEVRGDGCACHCAPRIAMGPAAHPFADRVVFIGDCAVTRLYKDGIGAAYRTAKAAARTAMFHGVSAAAFKRHYAPLCKSIAFDNRIGKFTFAFARLLQKIRFARGAIRRMTIREQESKKCRPRMSTVLWDMFTGSSSYADTFLSTLHPVFLARLTWSLLCSFLRPQARTVERSDCDG